MNQNQIFINMVIEHEIEQSDEVPYSGLTNEGTTCYLNSLIQTLFFTRSFRNAIYSIPSDGRHDIPFSLQRIFYNLEKNSPKVRTIELLKAFGWSLEDRNEQKDINEFNMALREQIKEHMEDTYTQLFEGAITNVVKCENVPFMSERDDVFMSL